MSTNANCDLTQMEKLCDPEEAKLLWDEYKYRHDLIWKHLIRSTIVVIILITVPYSTQIVANNYLILGSSVSAFFYLCHTFWITFRENKLLEKVKVLHRKRQIHYLDLPPQKCFTCDSELKGKFFGRIFWYLFFLLLLVIYTVLMSIYAQNTADAASTKAKDNLNKFSNSEITVSDLLLSYKPLDELISRFKKHANGHDSGNPELAGLAEPTAMIDKLTNAINQQDKKIPDKNVGRNHSCSKLENFLRRNVFPINFDPGSDVLKMGPDYAFRKLAAYLAENSNVYINIEGHTDSIGSDEANMSLGQRRALAVKNELSSLGVNQDRIFVVSYGEQLEKLTGKPENQNDGSRKVLIKVARTFEGRCFQ